MEEQKSYELDLTVADKGLLNESFLSAFGYMTKLIMQRMFGQGPEIPIAIKGNEQQVGSFAHALASEKRYMESFMRFGLDDPKTYKNRARLDQAVSEFERSTGLVWPFK
mgnify:FL=1